MRIVNTYYNWEFKKAENEILVITIENSSAYSHILNDLWLQYEGGDGSFILSDDDCKEIKLSVKTECIYNPFSINFNSRKIITKLYNELNIQSETFVIEDTTRIKRNLIEYMDKLTESMPYNIAEVTNIIKAFDVKIDYSYDNFLEKMINYIKIVSSLCNINIFIFNDIKKYFSPEEIPYLYEYTIYNKLHFLIFEPVQSYKNKNEKRWIIDNDLCIIEV